MSTVIQTQMARKPEIDYERGLAWASRSLRKSGNSVVLAIPPEMMKMVGWDEGDEIAIHADLDSEEIHLTKAE